MKILTRSLNAAICYGYKIKALFKLISVIVLGLIISACDYQIYSSDTPFFAGENPNAIPLFGDAAWVSLVNTYAASNPDGKPNVTDLREFRLKPGRSATYESDVVEVAGERLEKMRADEALKAKFKRWAMGIRSELFTARIAPGCKMGSAKGRLEKELADEFSERTGVGRDPESYYRGTNFYIKDDECIIETTGFGLTPQMRIAVGEFDFSECGDGECIARYILTCRTGQFAGSCGDFVWQKVRIFIDGQNARFVELVDKKRMGNLFYIRGRRRSSSSYDDHRSRQLTFHLDTYWPSFFRMKSFAPLVVIERLYCQQGFKVPI